MLHLRRHYVWHQSLFFASLITGFKLAPTGFLHRQQVSIPDSDKFSIDHSFFCNACCSCLGRIGNCLVIEKMDISTFRFRVFSMFLLVLDAFLERWWICRGLVLGLFSFLFHSCAVKVFAFLSLVHVFRCRRAKVMGAIVPLSLAKRLVLQVW